LNVRDPDNSCADQNRRENTHSGISQKDMKQRKSALLIHTIDIKVHQHWSNKEKDKNNTTS